MKKKINIDMIIIVALVFSLAGCMVVSAANENVTCEGLLGNDMKEYLSEIFKYIRIIGMVLALGLGFVDYFKAVLSKDADELKGATSKFIKRLIAAVIIFFLPYILDFVLSLIDGLGETCVGTGGTQ